jgi:sulfofructose kinase
MARIICVGLACLDHLFKVDHLPAGGGKIFAENYVAAPGGPAAAASIAAAALGHDAVFLGRLGDDDVGRELTARMARCGVDVSGIRYINGQSSQVSSVVIDQDGERQIINFSSKHLDPDPSWLPEEIVAGADFVLTDVRWPEGAEEALKRARQHNTPSLIDADISPIDTSHLIGLANYAVFSEKGLQTYADESDIEKGLQGAHRKSRVWVAVTAGDKGSYWLDEKGVMCSCPAELVEAVDTCGAGDVFHGAFAAALAEKMAIDEAMRFAGATASLKCLSFGGSLGTPDRAAVDRFLKKA